MKKKIGSLIIFLSFFILVKAQDFHEYFEDKTLRVDYTFSGTADKQFIYLDEISAVPGWAGRKKHLSEIPLSGNGQIEMQDQKNGNIIYKSSFSTLFQEWLTTEEAQTTPKSFENVYLLPYPKQPVNIKITLTDNKGKVKSSLTHFVSPDDMLISFKGVTHITPYKYLLRNGTPEKCIDVAILAEGYTQKEMPVFYKDAEKVIESIFEHEPFKHLKNKFNIIAVESVSLDKGVSSPKKGQWKHTAFSSHFDTFYSERYLTTTQVKTIHNVLAGIPYEHIIILANTDQYGGGGIYNAFTLTTAHHKNFKPVVVHEFGHSFAGLADEYYYEEDLFNDTYPFDVEPWEPNITTLIDFTSKWKDMLSPDTPIPTPVQKVSQFPVGVYEGGGYSAKGIYRPSVDCRMKTNASAEFCPVCQKSIEKLIKFYTE